jgi:hypothetical protein
MKLYRGEPGWAERLVAAAAPSVTLDSAVPHLSRLPLLRERIKIRVRALLHPLQTPAWLRLLNSHPAFSEYVRNCPRFLYKVYRPYISQALIRTTAWRRSRPTTSSSSAAASASGGARQPGAGGAGVLRGQERPALRDPAAHGEHVRPRGRAGAAAGAGRQGDLHGRLHGRAARRPPAISIGCVQGGKLDDAREAIRLATRDLHGMRPKQLMVSLVRQLGFEYGCERLHLVSNRNRVIYKAIKHGRVLADYDLLWEELGAVKNFSGDYELDCTAMAAPDLESIRRRSARRPGSGTRLCAAGRRRVRGLAGARLTLFWAIASTEFERATNFLRRLAMSAELFVCQLLPEL